MRGYELYKTGFQGAERFTRLRTSLTKTIDSWKEKDAPPIPEPLKKGADELLKKVKDMERLFTAPSDPTNTPTKYVPPPVADRIAHALYNIETYTAAPRQRDLDQLTQLAPIEKDALDRLHRLIDVDLANLNKALRNASVPYVSVPPAGSATDKPTERGEAV